MTYGNWNPTSASSYLALTWNREGYVLAAGSYVQANLTLGVSPSVSGITSFNFDMILVGTA
jgi:hypothetical protein